jgi:hypothetical protein
MIPIVYVGMQGIRYHLRKFFPSESFHVIDGNANPFLHGDIEGNNYCGYTDAVLNEGSVESPSFRSCFELKRNYSHLHKANFEKCKDQLLGQLVLFQHIEKDATIIVVGGLRTYLFTRW